MRIAIWGAGGIGAIYGAALAEAGNEVVFIARGPHLAAMRAHGLRITGHGGGVHLPTVEASDRPGDIVPVDLVLFCVKLYDTESAAEAMRPIVGPGTVVVTLQNGVDGRERIGAVIGGENVLAGAAHLGGFIEQPGLVRRTTPGMRIVFGEAGGGRSPRIEEIAGTLAAAGITTEISDDIDRDIWAKFVILACNAGMTCVSRLHIREVYRDPELRALAQANMAEIVAVAAAKGVALPGDIVEAMTAASEAFPPEMTTSTHNDLKRGKRMELPWLSGLVARLGAELDVATPVNRAISAALAPYVAGEG